MLQTLLTLAAFTLVAPLGTTEVRAWDDSRHHLADLADPTATAPLVINVWATWCPPCRAELPWLLDLHQRGRIQLIAVNLGDRPAAVARFLAAEGLEALPVYFASHRDLAALGIPGLPTTFVVTADGVSTTHYGPLTPASLADLLEETEPQHATP